MVTSSAFIAVVFFMSLMAAILGAMFAAARGIARWARARGRRPWVWVIGAYVAVNVAIGIAQVVVRGGR